MIDEREMPTWLVVIGTWALVFFVGIWAWIAIRGVLRRNIVASG